MNRVSKVEYGNVLYRYQMQQGEEWMEKRSHFGGGGGGLNNSPVLMDCRVGVSEPC
jgi:hypothetical protein